MNKNQIVGFFFVILFPYQRPFFLSRECTRWNQANTWASTAVIQARQKEGKQASWPNCVLTTWLSHENGKGHTHFAVLTGLILRTANTQTSSSRKRIDGFYFASNMQFFCVSQPLIVTSVEVTGYDLRLRASLCCILPTLKCLGVVIFWDMLLFFSLTPLAFFLKSCWFGSIKCQTSRKATR